MLLDGVADAALPIREQALLALGKLAHDPDVAGRLPTLTRTLPSPEPQPQPQPQPEPEPEPGPKP